MLIDNKGISAVSRVLTRTSAELSTLLGRPVIASFEFTDVELVSQTKIIQVVAQVTGVAFDEMAGRSKTNRLVFARYHCYRLMRKYLAATTVLIGRTFGKDHSTVVAGLDTFSNLYKTDAGFRAEHDQIEQLLMRDESND